MKRFVIGIGMLSLLSLAGIASAQTTFSSSSLGTAVDNVSGTAYDYFTVLITKFWPFLLGALVLVGVIVFGKRIILALFQK